MPEDNDDKRSNMKLPPELHAAVRKEIGARMIRGEKATFGSVLLEAWLGYQSGKGAGAECPICKNIASGTHNLAEKNLPPELLKIVEEFIRFVTDPGPDDAIWRKYTLEVLQKRISEREGQNP